MALPERPMYLENNAENKKPINGKKIKSKSMPNI
jgi:hypothetical protein